MARLARLGLSQDEMERLQEQLSDILANFEILQQIDTADVSPTGHSIALENVMRDDEVRPSLPSEAVLANAPATKENYFKVHAVLE